MKPYQDKVEIGPHVLYLGDCREILPTLSGIDAVVTDPPYGVGLGEGDRRGGQHGLARSGYIGFEDTYDNFVDLIVPRINTALDLARRGAVFTGPHIHEQRKPDAIGGVYCSAAAGRHKWGFKNFLPVLLYGTAAGLQQGAKYPSAISSNATASRSDHPCPKPVEWMEWLANLASLPAEIVLDPFMGSGTTGVACERLGRRFIGIEIEPRYFDIARRRIERAVSERPLPFADPEPADVQPALFD